MDTISYDDAQRYISTAANAIDLKTSEDGIYIPSGVLPGQFVQHAFDNLDFQEHTKDGTTLHATSHILYQNSRIHTDEHVKVMSIQTHKVRERTVPQPEPLCHRVISLWRTGKTLDLLLVSNCPAIIQS